MITKYDRFLMESTLPKPEDFGITEYKWVDGKLDCYQSVDLREKQLEKIPFPFGKIFGNLNISFNKIENLENAPTEITGMFDCGDNPDLTSLMGCPTIVGDNFFCSRNPKLKNLDHLPKHLKYHLFINNTPKIKYLDQYPVSIIGKGIYKKENKKLELAFERVCQIIKSNRDVFEVLLDDSIKFHQQIMRLAPEVVPFYKNIQIPSKKTII